jgi:hypothetical protein
MQHLYGRGVALILAAAATGAAAAQTPSGASICPREFEQVYEWHDGGYRVNGARDFFVKAGSAIENDPGPNTRSTGTRRVWYSNGNAIVVEESRAWAIQANQENMIAGRQPFGLAREIVKKSVTALIGNDYYLLEEVTGKRPKRVREPRGGRGVPMRSQPGVAPLGAAPFTRLGSGSVLGTACVRQRFDGNPNGRGVRSEGCYIEFAPRCNVAKLIEPLEHTASNVEGARITLLEQGASTTFRHGAVGAILPKGWATPPF